MKSSLISSAALVLLALGIVSVSGQEMKKLEVIAVPCEYSIKREFKRVPRAEIQSDESGEIVYKINANESWRRTDIEVKSGQKIEISATGTVRWAQDGSAWTFVTPDGTRAPRLDYFPHPDAGIGSLVIRIGKSVYPAGSSVTIEAEDDGLVEFQINDDILTDNSGHFLVKLSVREF